jgi:hypothetical protein
MDPIWLRDYERNFKLSLSWTIQLVLRNIENLEAMGNFSKTHGTGNRIPSQAQEFDCLCHEFLRSYAKRQEQTEHSRPSDLIAAAVFIFVARHWPVYYSFFDRLT